MEARSPAPGLLSDSSPWRWLSSQPMGWSDSRPSLSLVPQGLPCTPPFFSAPPSSSLVPTAQPDPGLGAGPDAASAPGGAEETSVTEAGGQGGPRAGRDIGLLSSHHCPSLGCSPPAPAGGGRLFKAGMACPGRQGEAVSSRPGCAPGCPVASPDTLLLCASVSPFENGIISPNPPSTPGENWPATN